MPIARVSSNLPNGMKSYDYFTPPDALRGRPSLGLPFTYLSASDINSLERTVKNLPQGAICVEIGSYLGASAIVIASNLAYGGKLYCVDIWRNDPVHDGLGPRDTYPEFLKNTVSLSEKIVAVRSTSSSASAKLSMDIDFLFIDSDHSYDGCKSDVDMWLPKVKDGGIVAFHDVGWAEGVQKVIRENVLPIQIGAAVIGSNTYTSRVTRFGPPWKTKAARSAHPFVVSKLADPSGTFLAEISRGLGDCPWSWVSAGLERRGCTEADPQRTEVLDAGAPGLVAGRHKALEECRDDVIIYLDDDVILPAGWIESIVEPFADPDIHFVGCRYLPDYEYDPPAWLEGLWQEDNDGFRVLPHLSLLDGGELSRCYRPSLVWGLCFAARREMVVRLGGFNPDGYPWELRRFRGDGETGLTLKAEMLGLKAFYQGKIHVNHRVPASRMTPQYFERRSFLQGISDSYTQIRRDHAVPTAPRRSWKDLVRPAKRKLERDLILRSPTVEGVRRLMARSHGAGMEFHRSEVCHDPSLLEWVLKQDYFDYRLPNVWERPPE